jgi:hypothetical protein
LCKDKDQKGKDNDVQSTIMSKAIDDNRQRCAKTTSVRMMGVSKGAMKKLQDPARTFTSARVTHATPEETAADTAQQIGSADCSLLRHQTHQFGKISAFISGSSKPSFRVHPADNDGDGDGGGGGGGDVSDAGNDLEMQLAPSEETDVQVR